MNLTISSEECQDSFYFAVGGSEWRWCILTWYARAHDGVEMGRERVGDLQCRQHPGEANNL